MKILQIIQRPQLRGVEIFTCQLTEELIKLGYDIDILYLFPQKNALKDFKVNFRCLYAEPAKRLWNIKAYKKLAKIVNEEKYDIVQANAGDTLKYASISRLFFGWKAKLIFRNANKMSAFIKDPFHKQLNRFFLSKVDHYISVSENCRQDLIKLYAGAAQKSSTGTIGTYPVNGVDPMERNSDKGPIWINVGSFVPEKNHAFLIDLFHRYFTSSGKGELWLVGDGKLRNKLEKLVKELGLQDRVIFFGFRRDVITLLKTSEVMVMPSKIEGLPGVILEALSVGLPVIAANVGGVPEVITSGDTGFCIEGYEPRDYLNKVDLVLSDKQLYDKISKNGKNLINEKFLMPKVAVHFSNIYQHVLGISNES